MTLRGKKIHRAWTILVGCCLLQGGSLGLIQNCRGIFYVPVILDLGFGMGAFSFYMLFFGVCSCLVLPFVGKLFEKADSRLLLGGASLVFSASVFVMGFFRSLPAFYIAGAFQGFAAAFLMYYPAPYILGRWFRKKTGLAVGISAAFAGIVGVVGNPWGAAVLERFGWRNGYFIFGIVSFLMMFPVSVFLLRSRPEEIGLRPYGAETPDGAAAAAPPSGLSAREARHTVSFRVLILAGLFAAATVAYYAHLSPLGIYAGYGVSFSALMVSWCMVGNMISKILLGHMYDRLGLGVALAAGTAVTAAGFLLLLVDSPAVRIPGAFLFGFSMAMSSVMIAISIKDIYGPRAYGELLSYSSMASSLGTSAHMCLIGFIVDAMGQRRGYPFSLWLGVCLSAGMGLLLFLSVRQGRRDAARG